MKVVDLGQLVKIQKGKKLHEVFEESADSMRYIQIDDLRNNENIKYALTDSKSTKCVKSDILIAWDGANAGTVGFGLEGAIGSTIAKLSPIKEFYIPYVGRLLQSKFNFLRGSCTGATIPHISKSALLKIQIPVISISEQKRIAAILDKADALRQKNKQLLAAYDELLQATFLDMFGDPVANPNGWEKKLLTGCYISAKEGTKCGPFGSALKKNEYTVNGIPVWTMDNIQSNRFVEGKSLFISEKKYNELVGYKTEINDIIISRAGTVGKMCCIPFEGKAIISTNLIRLRLNHNILLPIFFTTLMSNWGPKVARLKTGSDDSFTHMNTGVLDNIELPVPPIALQNKFAEIVKNIEAQKALLRRSIQESEDLFNGLVQKAFKGEL